MTLVMNQLLDSKLTEADDEEEKGNKSIEKEEDDALVLWDCVSLFDIEEEGYVKQEKILETNVTTRSQGLIKEDRSVLLKIKRLQENVKKIQKSTTTNKIPEFTITSQDPNKISMPINPIEEKMKRRLMMQKGISKSIRWSMTLWKILRGLRQISHCLKCVICLSRKKNC